jgi:hypothetical protein
MSLGMCIPGRESTVNRLLRLLLPLLCATALGASAHALPITLVLDPGEGPSEFEPGETVTVELTIGGLHDGEAQIALESFDLDLSFDTSRLQFESLVFGSLLGNPADEDETFLIGPGTPNETGVVVMGEFSFLDEASLLALQTPTFALAWLEFTVLDNPGPAELELINLTDSSLGGVGGNALGDDLATPAPLVLTVLPEPASGALLGFGALLLARRRRAH